MRHILGKIDEILNALDKFDVRELSASKTKTWIENYYLERLNLLRWVDQCGQDLANAGLNSAFDWDNFDICDQTSYAWS